jgi:O-antigen/teichoic acid export membrane protein
MRIAANTLYSLAQLGLGRFASVATLVALAWTQGPALVGVFSLALTFHILLTGCWIGFDDKVVREIARTRSENTDNLTSRLFTWQAVSNYLQIKGLLGVTLLTIVAGIIYWGGWYEALESWFIILLLMSSVTDNAISAVIAGYAGNERFSIALIIISIQTIFRISFTALAIWGEMGLLAVAVAWLAASLLTAAFSLRLFVVHFYHSKATKPFELNNWSSVIQLKRDWSFAIMGIVVILEYQLDIILLSLFRTSVEVGYYSIATTFFALATLPVQAFRIAIYPMMSRIAASGNAERSNDSSQYKNLQSLYTWATVSVLTISLPCALLGFFFAEPAITFVFGPAMTPSTIPTQILMVTVVIFSLNVPHSRFLLATNQQDKAARFITMSAIINILANLWLGQTFGAPGTAAARSISTTTFLLLAGVSVGRFVRLPTWRMSLAPITAAVLTAAFLLLSSMWIWWIAAAFALLLYGVIWWSINRMVKAHATSVV